MARFNSFEEFWPFYVKEHSHPLNRALHFIGSTCGALTAGAALATFQWWALPLAPVIGYGFAWIGHFLVEKNKPATFKYPLWSFMGDWVMWFKILTGRMNEELARVAQRDEARLRAVN